MRQREKKKKEKNKKEKRKDRKSISMTEKCHPWKQLLAEPHKQTTSERIQK